MTDIHSKNVYNINNIYIIYILYYIICKKTYGFYIIIYIMGFYLIISYL